MSSIVDGFAEYREAARRGIISAGGEAILVNEDFPSLNTSPRNACLDAIATCDFMVTIVGSRGGWTAPSGKLVVTEEFEHARSNGIPVFAFIQNTARDQEAERVANELSAFVDGLFRTTFETSDQLAQAVKKALDGRINHALMTGDMTVDLSPFLKDPDGLFSSMATVRLVISPEREEEVISPMRIGSDELRDSIYRLGHARDVRLFDYARPTSAVTRGDELVIDQSEANGRHGEGEYVKLTIAESGRV